MTHICISKLSIIGSVNGLSPGQRQVIIWTNAEILLIGPLRKNFSELLVENQKFSFKKIWLKMSSAKYRHFVLASICQIAYFPVQQTLMPESLGPVSWSQGNDNDNKIYPSPRTRSMPWLLMPWCLASPGHQQPWHWAYRINILLCMSSIRRCLKYSYRLIIDIWCNFISPNIYSVWKGLTSYIPILHTMHFCYVVKLHTFPFNRPYCPSPYCPMTQY